LILREMFRNRTQFNRIIDALTPRASTQRIKSLQRLDLVERRVISKSPTRENSQFRRQRYGFVLCIYLWLIYSVLCILLLSIFFSDRHVVLHVLSLYLVVALLSEDQTIFIRWKSAILLIPCMVIKL
jgi:hypothetical protein